MLNTVWVKEFKGLNDSVIPGQSSQHTDDLKNVKVKFGRVIGRGGMDEYEAATPITASGSNHPIIGLFPYNRSNQATNQLVRMTPIGVHVLSGSTWSDITGTALTGTTLTRPQFDIIDDTLVFTNEGEDIPRKYTGSGNTAVIGGSPPYCKGIIAYLGFLFLINYSTAGTFTDVTDGYRSAIFSDDWDNDWDSCESLDTITLAETPGAWVGAVVLGKSMYAIKTDGVVKVTFTGGQVRFRQDRLDGTIGCTAPLSIQKLTDDAAIFRGTNNLLYLLRPDGYSPISEQALKKTVTRTISALGTDIYSRSFVDPEDLTYYMTYARQDLTGQFTDSYVSYNFTTEEFAKGELGKNVLAAAAFTPADGEPTDLLLAGDLDVYTFDAAEKDDAGVAVDRHWTTGWQPISENVVYHGARLIFEKSARARVKISMATDLDPTFRYEKTYSLKGRSASETFADLLYEVGPHSCRYVNFKIKAYHDSDEAFVKLTHIGLIGEQMAVGEKRERAGQAARA